MNERFSPVASSYLFGDVHRSPKSPDFLTVCDWGYLKSRVYESKPRTLDILKDIRAAMNEEFSAFVQIVWIDLLMMLYKDGRHNMPDVILSLIYII